MNVHLIKTPEMPDHECLEVYDLLRSVPGPVKFLISDIRFDEENFPFLGRFWEKYRFDVPKGKLKFFDAERLAPLSWRELFSVCGFYRAQRKLADEDFVMLLTRRRNALNFFSCFEDGQHNAFIQTSDWELFTKSAMKYPVGYEVWANVLRKLMGMALASTELDQFMHLNSIGCMNDFCQNKQEIVLKLRTADVCDGCLEKLKMKNISNEVVFQALHFFEEVRSQMLFSQGFTRSIMAYPIDVVGTKIMVNNAELKLAPIAKALYLFFLQRPDGVKINELSDHREELVDIYLRVRPGGDVKKMISVTKLINGTFDYNKSRLNAAIKNHFGDRMAAFYTIEGKPGEKFKVGLEKGMVRFGGN